MDKTLAISVVIPAFNEAERIGQTIEAVARLLTAKRYDYELIVVSDGSTDMTVMVVKATAARCAIPLQLIENEKNSGKGHAVRQGVLASRGEVVFFTDADLSAAMDNLDGFLAQLAVGADVVIASRAMAGAQLKVRQPFWREGIGKTFNWLVRKMFKLDLSDTQ